jgi:Spy/CpxP family protein refolding chaperone
MKRFAVFALAALAMACSSTDSDQPVYSPPRGEMPATRPVAGGLDLFPPAQWWRQPLIADAVKLTSDQMVALDKVDQSEEIARIDRDTVVAVRELRQLLDSNQPAPNDIVAAGQRLRAMRDTMFDRQVKLLADERSILTQQQWQSLQSQLQERRTRRNQENNYPRRGGRGMGGGRGRWPGF